MEPNIQRILIIVFEVVFDEIQTMAIFVRLNLLLYAHSSDADQLRFESLSKFGGICSPRTPSIPSWGLMSLPNSTRFHHRFGAAIDGGTSDPRTGNHLEAWSLVWHEARLPKECICPTTAISIQSFSKASSPWAKASLWKTCGAQQSLKSNVSHPLLLFTSSWNFGIRKY